MVSEPDECVRVHIPFNHQRYHHCIVRMLFFTSWYFFYEIFGVLVRLFFVSFVFDAVAHSILFIFFVVLLLLVAFHEIRVYGIRIVYIWQKRVLNDA